MNLTRINTSSTRVSTSPTRVNTNQLDQSRRNRSFQKEFSLLGVKTILHQSFKILLLVYTRKHIVIVNTSLQNFENKNSCRELIVSIATYITNNFTKAIPHTSSFTKILKKVFKYSKPPAHINS